MDPISAAYELLVEALGPVGTGLGGFGLCWIISKGLAAAGRGDGASAALPALAFVVKCIGFLLLAGSVLQACNPTEPPAPVPLGTTMEIPAGPAARNPYAQAPAGGVSAPSASAPEAPASSPYLRK